MIQNNNNMRKIVFIVALFMATVANATSPIDSARSYVNSNIVTNGSKAITGLKMNTALNGIIDAIDSTRVGIGVTINSLRKVDTIYANTGADSLVYKISGVRYAIAVGGGGAALSDITAATTAHTIDNGDNKQEWQFNSHVAGSAFKLSAALNAAHTPVIGAAVFGVTLSNSYLPPFSGTNYAAKFVNNYYSVGGSNTAVAGYFETGDPYDPKHSAVYARGNIRIEASTGKLYFGNYTRIHGADGSLIFSPSTSHTNNAGSYIYGMEAGYASMFIRNFSSTTYTNWQSSYLYKDISSSRQVVAFGVDHDLYTTAGVGTSYGWIERNADKLMFAAQAGLSSRTPITPNYLLTCYGTNSNVGIGTTTPNASAKLDVSSTTQGFAPPEMTATQASAITTTTRKLIIYVTDTNGTFTSAGLWMWNGTTWKLILAE